MHLRRKLPPGRTKESVEKHYLIEKEIAQRLKASTGASERRQILATMYDELFRAVPDHPRLTRRADPLATKLENRSRLRLLGRFLSASTVLVEFGAGDCLLASEAAQQVNFVYAVDISDQRASNFQTPRNFRLVTYDGYERPDVALSSVDVCFSDALIEHLHPEDIQVHLAHVNQILKPGGVYVFRTPHAQSGPDDISQYFSPVAEGFHLKEWTYTELLPVLKGAGFDQFRLFWQARALLVRLPITYFLSAERAIALLPEDVRPLAAKLAVPSIFGVAKKALRG